MEKHVYCVFWQNNLSTPNGGIPHLMRVYDNKDKAVEYAFYLTQEVKGKDGATIENVNYEDSSNMPALLFITGSNYYCYITKEKVYA